MDRLGRSFFLRPTLTVASDLLGTQLTVLRGNKQYKGIITETEAYTGTDDLASHSSKGRTKRTETMWMSGGHLYVYLIYGIYHCMNIVTEDNTRGSAVLIRGMQLIEPNCALFTGPGKICKTLEITRENNGLDLCAENSPIYLESRIYQPKRVYTLSRVGVQYAGEWARKPYRFLGEFSEFPETGRFAASALAGASRPPRAARP